MKKTPYIDELGREINDPNPMEVPLLLNQPKTLQQIVRELFKNEADRQSIEGYETFEEADDFFIEDDPPDPSTPYERDFEGTWEEIDKGLKEMDKNQNTGVEKELKASPGGESSPINNDKKGA